MKKKWLKFFITMALTVLFISGSVLLDCEKVFADGYAWAYERGAKDEFAELNMKCVDAGYMTNEQLYKECCANYYSVGVIEDMLNRGYMSDYVQQLKDGGWIPNDFTPTPVSNTSNSSSSSATEDTTPTVTYTQEEIDAAWKETKKVEPTCVADGYIEYKNSLTGDKKKETLPMVEHSYEKTETPSTCTEAGVITYTCSVCADTYTEELPLAEHSFDEEMVYYLLSSKASCTEDVKISYSCTVCQSVMEEILPATGHDNGEWVTVKEASWFSEGVKELRCTKDAVVLATENIPQTCPVSLGVVLVIIVSLIGIILVVIFMKLKKRK